MAYNIIFEPNVNLEITEQIDWYNSRSKGLGFRFYKNLQNQIATISKNPYLFANKYKSTRVSYLKIFPFAIYYIIFEDTNTVLILAILHTSRKPLDI